MSIEIWKPVVGYEGTYEISNFGRVRSLDRVRNDKRHNLKGKILRPQFDGHKYHFVCLWQNSKSKQHSVHKLVLLSFVGPRPDDKPYCNHKNGNKIDNRPCNLEWCSPSENNLHAFRVLGRAPVVLRGENGSFSKLTQQAVNEIRRLRQEDPSLWTFQRLGEKFGIVKSHAKRIIDYVVWAD